LIGDNLGLAKTYNHDVIVGLGSRSLLYLAY